MGTKRVSIVRIDGCRLIEKDGMKRTLRVKRVSVKQSLPALGNRACSIASRTFQKQKDKNDKHIPVLNAIKNVQCAMKDVK